MRFVTALVFACALSAAPEAPGQEGAVSAAPVIAAERAFAADGAERGWAAAFRRAAASLQLFHRLAALGANWLLHKGSMR